MAEGPGKYDAEATLVREQTQAQAVVLIVCNGNRGSGFSVQAHGDMPPLMVADLLELLAKGLRHA